MSLLVNSPEWEFPPHESRRILKRSKIPVVFFASLFQGVGK